MHLIVSIYTVLCCGIPKNQTALSILAQESSSWGFFLVISFSYWTFAKIDLETCRAPVFFLPHFHLLFFSIIEKPYRLPIALHLALFSYWHDRGVMELKDFSLEMRWNEAEREIGAFLNWSRFEIGLFPIFLKVKLIFVMQYTIAIGL